MSPRSKEYFWRAHRSLESAKLLRSKGLFEDAVSRAYYVILEAAKGALSEHGRHAKTHRGVWSQFNDLFISNGLVDGSWSTVIGKLQYEREQSDYEAKKLDQESADSAVDQAEQFLMMLESMLEGNS